MRLIILFLIQNQASTGDKLAWLGVQNSVNEVSRLALSQLSAQPCRMFFGRCTEQPYPTSAVERAAQARWDTCYRCLQPIPLSLDFVNVSKLYIKTSLARVTKSLICNIYSNLFHLEDKMSYLFCFCFCVCVCVFFLKKEKSCCFQMEIASPSVGQTEFKRANISS